MFIYDEPPIECFECYNKTAKLDEIAYWFEGALDQIYGNESFNADALEHCLNEIALTLGVKLPPSQVAVEGKSKRISIETLLKQWTEDSNAYLKQLTNKGA